MPSRCPRCAVDRSAAARWCGRCGAALGAADPSPADTRATRRGAVALSVPVLLVAAVVGLGVTDAPSVRWPTPTPPAASGEVRVPTGPGETGDPGGARDAGDLPPGPTTDGADAAGVVWEQTIGPDLVLDARAVEDDVVVLDARGRLTALDATDGSLRWHRHLPASSASSGPLRGAVLAPLGGGLPVRHDGTVIEVDPETGEAVPSTGSMVSMVDPRTGEIAWARPLPPDATTVSTGRRLLIATPERITALDDGGRTRWEVEVPGGTTTHLHRHGVFLVLADDTVRSLDGDGTPRWERSFDAPARPLPTTSSDGAPLLALDGDVPRLIAVEPADGAVRWEIPIDGEVAEVTVGGVRTLIAVRRDDGVDVLLAMLDEFGRAEVRRQLRIDGATDPSSPLLVGRQIVAVTGGDDPQVTFATPDALLRSREPGQGQVHATAPDTRTVLIADGAGVRGIALATGRERFAVPLPDARPVEGAPSVFVGDGRLVALSPSPG